MTSLACHTLNIALGFRVARAYRRAISAPSVRARTHVGVAADRVVPHAGIEREGVITLRDAVAEAVDRRRDIRSHRRPLQRERRRSGRGDWRDIAAAAARNPPREFCTLVRMNSSKSSAALQALHDDRRPIAGLHGGGCRRTRDALGLGARRYRVGRPKQDKNRQGESRDFGVQHAKNIGSFDCLCQCPDSEVRIIVWAPRLRTSKSTDIATY
jgi:hypothetical protein